MQEEIWKDVVGYEGLYQVSNLGRVKSVKHIVKKKNGIYMNVNERIMSTLKRGGYLLVFVIKNGQHKGLLVHRVVGEAFIENPQNLRDINHKDGNRLNNHVDNLEWCTHSHNIKHAYSVLGHRHVCRKVLCLENGVVYNSSVEAAKALGLNDSAIRNNARGITKSTIGYHFKNLNKELI